MQWDDLPAAFEDAAVRRAAAAALATEEIGGDVHAFGTAVGKAGRDLLETDRDEALLLIADQAACDFDLTTVSGRGAEQGPLGPMWEMDGQRYPPPPESFPDSLRTYLELRVAETTRSDLRARYNDLIWLRWHDFPSARRAHAAYLEAGTGRDLAQASSSMQAVGHLVRAAGLAATLGIEEDPTIETVRTEILRGLDRDAPGYSFWLAKGAARLLSKRPDVARELQLALLGEADREPEGRRHRQRSLLDAAETIARAVGDGDQANDLRRRQAGSFEVEAKERAGESGLIELAFLNDALRMYAAAGAGGEVQRLKPELAAASERSLGDLHVLSGTVTVPQEAFRRAADWLVEKFPDPASLLLTFADASGFWVSPEALAAGLENAMQEHGVLYLFGHISITGDGRYQPDPESEEDRRGAQLTRHLATETTGRVAVAAPVINDLRTRGIWNADNLIRALASVDEPIAASCRDAIQAFERGEMWVAAHLLVPQLERAVRAAVIAAGGSPRSRARRAGGLRWKSLEETLLEAEASIALGPALSSSLIRLFVDPFGPNYRNEIAHGAVEPNGDSSPIALLTLLAVLSVTLQLAAARDAAAGEAAAADQPSGGQTNGPAPIEEGSESR